MQIAEIAGITQGRVAQIINNTNFREINNLLSQGYGLHCQALQHGPCTCLDLTIRRKDGAGKNSKSLAGGFAHGISGTLMNVYPVKFISMTAMGKGNGMKSTPRKHLPKVLATPRWS